MKTNKKKAEELGLEKMKTCLGCDHCRYKQGDRWCDLGVWESEFDDLTWETYHFLENFGCTKWEKQKL